MKKKLTIIIAAMLILALSFAGCTTTSEEPTETKEKATEAKQSETETTEAAETAAILPLRYYMPGAATQQADLVNAAITEKMQADGLNIDFQPVYVPWDEWVNKINIMLSSGDEFELLHIMEDYVPTSTYASRGGLTPLDDLIDEYAPELWGMFEDIHWEGAKVKGETMTVPAYWRDNSGDGTGFLFYCKTRFDKYGIELPTTPEDLITTMVDFQKMQEKETGVKAYMYEHSATQPSAFMHRTYDSWPFFVSLDGIFMVTQDAEASLYFESDEFRKDCEFMNECYTLGLIHPDILNLPRDTITTYKQNGDYILGLQTSAGDVLDEAGNLVLDFEKYCFNPEGQFLSSMPITNTNAVPSTCTHPELGIQFLNWMYSAKENQDLVLYGIEGEQWTAVGDDEYERIKDESGSNLYAFDFWMIEYVPLHRFDANRTTSEKEDLDQISNIYADRTVFSPVIGFSFNSEAVSVEYANMMAEYTASILPIKRGVIPYEGNYEDGIARMKAAGSDVVISEYQRQLDEFLASK